MWALRWTASSPDVGWDPVSWQHHVAANSRRWGSNRHELQQYDVDLHRCKSREGWAHPQGSLTNSVAITQYFRKYSTIGKSPAHHRQRSPPGCPRCRRSEPGRQWLEPPNSRIWTKCVSWGGLCDDRPEAHQASLCETALQTRVNCRSVQCVESRQ